MKTLLLAAIAGVFLFSGSAAVSWYLMNQQQMAETEQGPETPAEVEPGAENVPPVTTVEKTEEMPVGLRPDAPITLEAVIQLSKSVRLKEQQLKAEEERLRKERDGIDLMFKDLELERDQMKAFGDQIDSKIRSLRELVERAKIETEKLDARQKESSLADQDPDDLENEVAPQLVKEADMARKMLGTMDAESVAEIIKKWADRGKLKLAGMVIKGLDERQGTKVLTALSNTEPELVMQLLEAASKTRN